MSKYLVLSLFLFLFISAVSFAADYYVDRTAGNDSNPGDTPNAPWQFSPGMSSYSGSVNLLPGDTVYFDSSDTWTVTGDQGLYLVGGVTYIGDSWGGGTRARIMAGASIEAGVIRFRDHATFETVFQGFDVDVNNQVATGIDIQYRWAQGLMNGATKRIDNCEVHNVWSRQSRGEYAYGIVISNYGGADYYAENVEVLNTVVHDISRDGIALYPGGVAADCRIRNITVRGCEVFNTGQDPDYGAGSGIAIKGYVLDSYIEYNYVHDTDAANILVNGNETNHFGVGQENTHIRYNILTNGNKSHAAIMIYDSGIGDPKDIKIYGNIIYDTPDGGITLLGLANDVELWVNNNTLYNAPVVINESSANYITFALNNNILYSEDINPVIGSSGSITSQSNNLTLDPLFINQSDPPAGFTGSFGIDLRPNTDGFSLASDSPAIDGGITLAAVFGGSVNSLQRPAGAAWDVGAYENGAEGQVEEKPDPPTRLRVIH